MNEEKLHEWVEALGGERVIRKHRIYVHNLFFFFWYLLLLTCDLSHVRCAVQFEDQDQLERYHLNRTWHTWCCDKRDLGNGDDKFRNNNQEVDVLITNI